MRSCYIIIVKFFNFLYTNSLELFKEQLEGENPS